MKLLVEIQDTMASEFFEALKNYSSVKAKTISEPDAALFNEIKEIKKAFKNVAKIKSGKLKVRPVGDLINEL